MKFSTLIPICALLTISCQSYTSSEKQAMIIPVDSAEAHMLALNAEDISILQEYYPKIAAKIHAKQPLLVREVVDLHESGLTPDTLIRIMKHTSSRFNLNSTEVIYLQAEGLPYKVINFMIES